MNTPFYALLELMGHVKQVGYASWQPGGMLRVDLLGADGALLPTRHYGPGALFCVRECTEEVARLTARHGPTSQDETAHWAVLQEPGSLPMCVLCDLPIRPTQPMSTGPGGKILHEDEVAHARCVDDRRAQASDDDIPY